MTTETIDLSNKLNVHEAAKAANRHEETVKRWLREGRLPGQKVGLVWFIDRVDLTMLLNSRGTQGVEDTHE